jgi:hypothetical protein
LHFEHFSVPASEAGQLIMTTFFGNPAVRQDDDPIG